MDLLKYIIFSFTVVLLNFFSSYAQVKDKNLYVEEEVKEPLVFKGIKIGVNVGRFSDFQFKPDRRSYEASIDFNLSNKYFGVIEAGFSEVNISKRIKTNEIETDVYQTNQYDLFSDGTFVKIGFDYNMLKKWPTDFLGIGVRIGWSSFSQTAKNINLDLSNWGSTAIPDITKDFNAYWLETSFGVKGEIFKNVYLGWAGIVRLHINGGRDSSFQVYDIPGYGTGTKSLHLAANYYIYYQIPFNKNK